MTERSIRVFISSTFRDMQAEREELVKRVFPELRRRCEQRGVTWGEVDLRWGVTDEEKAEGAVLPICLAEIEHSRPYFVGLLGERYGWVPDEIAADVRDRERWLGDVDGRSVTELEILHGVLNDPAMAGHAYFYLRDPAWSDRLPGPERADFVEQATADEVAELGTEAADARAAERRRRLAELKDRLRASGFPVHDGYPDPVALGELVLADLGAMVDSLFPSDEAPDPRARENDAHVSFATTRASAHIGRAAALAAIDAHVARPDHAPLLVTGPPGIGTSALLSAWALQTERAVVAHHVGASTEASAWVAMLRRLIAELAVRADLTIDVDSLPVDGDALKAAFADTLRQAAAVAPVVLVLDGVDELDDRDFARQLSWLPWTLPTGVDLIVSASASGTLEAALARGWQTLDVPPLSDAERRDLVTGVLARYAKRLGGDLMDRLVAAPHAGSPLFVRAVADELRQHGDHFTLGDALDRYVDVASVDDLFERILARWEADFERDRGGLVRDATSALRASRRGLSESELLDILGDGDRSLPHAAWSPLRLAAGESLAERSGLLGLAHAPLRIAVADRYLADGDARRHAHRRLADYWSARPGSPRALDELAWQLREAGEWDRLMITVTDAAYLAAAYRNDLADLRQSWAALEANGRRMIDGYAPVIADPAAHASVAWEVARLLSDAGYPAEAIALHRFCVADARAAGEPERRRLAAALANLAAAHLGRSELAEAAAALSEQESIARTVGDDAILQAALGNQAVVARSRGERARALELHAEEEAICRRLGDLVGLQASVGNQGTVAFDARDFGAALERFTEQERISRQIGDGRLIAGALSAQAQVMSERGDTDGALGLLARQEHELRRYGDVAGLATNLGNRAATYHQLGQLDEADALAAQEVDLAGRVGDAVGLARALFVRANVAHQRGDRSAALALLDEHEAVVANRGDRSGLAMNRGERATLAREAGQIPAALSLHADEERLYRDGGDISGVATSLGNQALVHHVAGDPASAVAKVTEQEALLRPLGLPAMLQACLANKAAILLAAGDGAGAEATLREQEELCRAIGNRAGLAAALGTRAQLALQRGDASGAIKLLDAQLAEALATQASTVVVDNLLAQAKLRPAVGDVAGLARVVTATEQSAQAAADEYVLAQCLAQRGTLAMGSGDGLGATRLFNEAAQLARARGNPHALQLALGNQGLLQLQQGDAAGAEPLLREQEQICRQNNIPDGLSAALGNLAIARQQEGDPDGALGLLTEQEALCRANGDAQGLVLALANRGEVTARLPGRRDEGLGLLDQAAATAQQIGWLAMVGPIQQLAAQLRHPS